MITVDEIPAMESSAERNARVSAYLIKLMKEAGHEPTHLTSVQPGGVSLLRTLGRRQVFIAFMASGNVVVAYFDFDSVKPKGKNLEATEMAMNYLMANLKAFLELDDERFGECLEGRADNPLS